MHYVLVLKERLLLGTDKAAHSTYPYTCIVCTLSLLKCLLQINKIKLTGLCMQELRTVYVM